MMMTFLNYRELSFLSILIVMANAFNNRPIIGVLTVPSELDDYDIAKYSTLEATYVQYIQSAGAIAVPIQWDASYAELEFLFDNVNGILLTGGDTQLYINETQPGFTFNKFTDTVSFFMSKAIQKNKAGTTFPIFGICQGFQVMNYIMSNYFPVLERVYDNLEKQRLFELTKKDSYMFKSMKNTIKTYIEKSIGPFEFNEWAVFDTTYTKVQSLRDFFDIVGYSVDGRNQRYIAAVQAKNYPFYSFQFHPEKNQFEFNSPANHTKELVGFGQHLINQFIQMARLNGNQMEQKELDKRVIWNFNPKFVDLYYLTQMYIFKRETTNTDQNQNVGINSMRSVIIKKQY